MSKTRTKKLPQTVVLMLFQGRPMIITNDDGNPHAFADTDEARTFTNEPHMAIDAADIVYIVDLATGEMDAL